MHMIVHKQLQTYTQARRCQGNEERIPGAPHCTHPCRGASVCKFQRRCLLVREQAQTGDIAIWLEHLHTRPPLQPLLTLSIYQSARLPHAVPARVRTTHAILLAVRHAAQWAAQAGRTARSWSFMASSPSAAPSSSATPLTSRHSSSSTRVGLFHRSPAVQFQHPGLRDRHPAVKACARRH